MGTLILHRKPERTVAVAAPVLLFPGQSSVGPDVVSRARSTHHAAEGVAERARSVLGDQRASRYLDERGLTPQCNRDVQIMVFLATQMYLAALAAEGLDAGDSLGLTAEGVVLLLATRLALALDPVTQSLG